MRLCALVVLLRLQEGGAAVERPSDSPWIDLLGDDRPEVRDQAESRLAELGVEIEAALARARTSSDAEVRLRADRLYRKRCIARLELSLGGPFKIGHGYYSVCYLRNATDIPRVVVNARFQDQTRVAYAVCPPNEEFSRWHVEHWKCRCLDEPHPFKLEDFVVLPPGETRQVGWIEIFNPPQEPFQVIGRYSFRRPDSLHPKYLTDPSARALYESAVEVEGIYSSPLDVDPVKCR